MPEWQKTKKSSVYVRHHETCPRRASERGRCNCDPSYRAQAWDPTMKRPARSPSYRDINEAAGWLVDFRRGHVAAPTARAERVLFRDLAEEFLRGAERGDIAAHGRESYSYRTIYSYRKDLEKHVLPAYGGKEAKLLDEADWQALVERLRAQGKATNTINNVLNPVRAIYRWACHPGRAKLPRNTVVIELPARDEQPRMRFATGEEAERLLVALPKQLDRLAYGMAFYAGMRRREIRPCTWDWVDLELGVIEVRESKTKAGTGRKVPIAEPLRQLLLEAYLAAGRPDGTAYVVPGERSTGMHSADALLKRAAKTWEDAELEPIGLHDCRHTYASWMIAAGVNAKALSTYMGHSSIQITFDRYGHLMPGNEAEAAALLDEYLARRAG